VLNEGRLRNANALTLKWHAGASTIGFEAFQPWCLALLKPRMRFDGAIWGVLDDADSSAERRIQSAHLHRIAEAAFADFERVRAYDLGAREPLSSVVNMCLADLVWEEPAHAAVRDHGRRNGMMNSLLMRFATPDSPGLQFVLLTRKSAAHRFSLDEAASFELLAPHMMQAFATCRKIFLDSSQDRDKRVIGFAAAMVDRAGVIHDQNARFVPMLRREWSDWKGKRLPEPLLELTARRSGTRWRFLGMQVSADFVPVDDLYLVTARPRHAADSLTQRETEVAQRYAAGRNFREIAEALNLAPATVRSHLRNVFSKLQIRNKSQLAQALR
jgi:DNA-binding CsgD family transcriptional regulator